jgi:predicted ATP-dependent serine protease
MAEKLTVKYCKDCSDTTEHWGGKCHPCEKLKAGKLNPADNKQWVKMSIEQKLDYLYKRIG